MPQIADGVCERPGGPTRSSLAWKSGVDCSQKSARGPKDRHKSADVPLRGPFMALPLCRPAIYGGFTGLQQDLFQAPFTGLSMGFSLVAAAANVRTKCPVNRASEVSRG